MGWVKLGLQLMGRVGLKRLIRIDFVLYIMPAIHGSGFAGSEFFLFLGGFGPVRFSVLKIEISDCNCFAAIEH